MASSSDDITEFIKNSKQRLQKILNRLNWTEEGVFKNFNTNSAACNKKQKVKSSSIPIPKCVTYPNSLPQSNSVVLETAQLQELLENPTKTAPLNFNEYQRNFSREEKLKIYEYVVKHTQKNVHSDVEEKNQCNLTFKEIMTQKRKEISKKRRHRVSKPSYVEEVRAVLDLQMQALQQYLGQETKDHEVFNDISPKQKNLNNLKKNDYYSVSQCSDVSTSRRRKSYDRQGNNTYKKHAEIPDKEDGSSRHKRKRFEKSKSTSPCSLIGKYSKSQCKHKKGNLDKD